MRSEIVLPAILAFAVLTACATEPSETRAMGRVTLQLATRGLGAAAAPAAADLVVTKGNDAIVISSVELVARKIRLEQEDASCDEFEDEDDAPSATPMGNDDDDGAEADLDEDEEECPVLRLGALLLQPPLVDGPVTSFTADVPVGTYTELELQIHKPRGSKDQAFIAAHPDFADVSIRVIGTFNGIPFTFETSITEELEIEFSTPIVVTTAGTTAFTLLLDVRGWFLDATGSALVNPTNLSDAIRKRIENNIRHSFQAFEDEDHDGEDDEHDG